MVTTTHHHENLFMRSFCLLPILLSSFSFLQNTNNVVLVASAAPITPNLDQLLGQNQCPDFKCQKGKSAAPKRRQSDEEDIQKFTFTSTGCIGMEGEMKGLSLSPKDDEDEEGLAFESCCDQWHACYQICGASKNYCDNAFEACAVSQCNDDNNDGDKDNNSEDDGDNDKPPKIEECTRKANLLKLLSKIQTCPKFTQAQKEACDCLESPAERREQVIADFYKTYSPGGVAKASELAEKASTSGLMAVLMRKLVAKYPDCIKRVEVTKGEEEVTQEPNTGKESTPGESVDDESVTEL